MNGEFKRLICAAVGLLLAAGLNAASGVPRGWEASEPPVAVTPVPGGDIAVATTGQWIYIVIPRQSNVTILTVLGQPLTDVSLPAGSYRFHLASRGIYILRVASSTFRITI